MNLSKDKIDLQCQGNSLKSSLEKIKLTFLDQFNEIYYKIENFENLKNNI